MRTILRMTLGAVLLSTLAVAPPPAAAASCIDPIHDPLDCVPCWNGGSSCPCDVGNPVGCGPCDPIESCNPCAPLSDCVPDECDTGACDVYVIRSVDPQVRSNEVVIGYRECTQRGWCRDREIHVPLLAVNPPHPNPGVVDHGNGSFTANYTQCDTAGGSCQNHTATTPNRVNGSTPATYSPGVPSRDVYTPGVPEVCAPFAIVCVSANPVYVTTVPGAGPLLLVPASGFDVGLTQLGFTTPSLVTTPYGPFPVTQDPVSIVVCRDTCAVPSGVTGGPYAQGSATVSVGGFSKEIPIGLP